MSWGLGSWGFAPWGLSAEPELTMLHAHARAEDVVRVTLSRGALRESSIGVNDALNPRTWAVVRSDTGFTFTVLSVREVEAEIAGSVFELLLLQKLGPAGVDHEVASTVVTPLGQVIEDPKSATFEGCRIAMDTAQAGKNAAVDLAKTALGEGEAGSIFKVGASGDYDVESGQVLLRKLFIRRLTTSPGGFFHLTEYGLGVAVKEPLTVPRLAALKHEVQRQLSLEPEVDSVTASVRLSSTGILQIAISARLLATGANIRDVLSIPTVSL